MTLESDASLRRELESASGAARWWIAFSGGLDSSVLLHLLWQWRQRRPGTPPLAALHVNHGLQGAADAWQRHCESRCAELGIPLHCEAVTVLDRGGGAEDAARGARYAAFEALLGADEVLFLAHHLDDQVETFFLRLLRGAGTRGLAAMPSRRSLGRGTLCRPLLALPRSTLAEHAAAHGLAWVEDDSNRDTGPDRNYLRREVLPLLAARWPGYRVTVNRAAEAVGQADEELRRLLPAPEPVRSVMGDPGVSLGHLPEAQRAAQSLRHWLGDRGLPSPPAARLREFLRQLSSRSPGAARMSWGDWSVGYYAGAVYLLPPACPAVEFEPIALRAGESCRLPGGDRLALVRSETGLVLAPGEALELRWRRGGERCRLPGRNHSHSLKKLLQERGVPPWWRDRLPLLYRGDELLAVGDLWLCREPRAATSGTAIWRPVWQRGAAAEPASD